MSNDFQEDKKFHRASLEEVCSLEFYLHRTLPYHDGALAEMVRTVRDKAPTNKDLTRAIIYVSAARSALQRYPESEQVRNYAARMERKFMVIAKHFPEFLKLCDSK